MSFENVQLAIEGAVAVLTIHRPAALNALNRATLWDIDTALTEIEGNPSVLALIVTGAGPKSFVAGADIAEMKDMSSAQAVGFAQLRQRVFSRLGSLRVPVIAAVNGFALGGGCELALACDLILAAENAKFGQPEVNLGVIPGFGGTQRLARLVGPMRARHLILSGETIGAEEAVRMGLALKVIPAATLLDEARKLATTIAGKGPWAVKKAREVIAAGLDGSLADGLNLEAEGFAACFDTADQKEGMGAFLAKRPAAFTGK